MRDRNCRIAASSMRFLVCSFLILNNLTAAGQLSADFVTSTVKGCTPLTVQFRDQSAGNPTSWFWDFGNHTTSTLQNPTAVYTDSGSFNVRLFVRNAGGADYEEKANYIIVSQTPEPQWTTLADSGCAPLKAAFTNITDILNASWLWDFGDGGTDSSQNPTHVFQSSGIYTVSLTASTAAGCAATLTVADAVRTGDKPKPDFTFMPTSGCASELRYFTNTSSGAVTSSFWSFGDGGVSVQHDPIYHYQDTGWMSVKLVAANNGCKDSIVKKRVLHVTGPVALMRAHIYCDDRFTVKFIDESIDENNRKWNFDDGTSGKQRAETHVYASEGVYTARLKVDNGSCYDTASYRLHVTAKKPQLAVVPQKTLYCKGDSILFAFTNYDTAFARSFSLDFGDDSVTGVGPKWDSATYAYANKGSYMVTGYFTDKEHCIDTITLNSPVVVTAPNPEFSFSNPDCIGMPINFSDKSTVDNGASLTRWIWNFDDGTMRYSANQVYNYSFPLTYNVSLLVKDSNGCADSIYHEVEVGDIPVVHASIDTFLCAGQAATLHASGATNYLWTRASELNCNNCSDPVATPLHTATYYVTGSNRFGCSSQDSVKIVVQEKQKVNLAAPPVSSCAGDSIHLLANGADSYLWSPQSCLNNATIANPTAFPTANTTFMVIGKDRNSCFSDTATMNIIVRKKPSVNIADSIVQLLAGSSYQIRAIGSEDVQRWQWLPANDLSCTNCALPTATVKGNVRYTVSVSNALGCTSEDAINLISLCTQEVLYVPNTFSPNNDGMNDYFFPRSNKGVVIKSLRIYNRWGQVVFQKSNFPANNYAYGWDGKFNNATQKSDVYVYIMEVECSNGNTVIRKGDVSLLR